MLNISAAQAYEALMVVHILSYPLSQTLYDLREAAESLHPELSMVWTGSRGEHTFDLLADAFWKVRFSADYHLTDGDLNRMFGYVEDLHKLIAHICQLKFEALKAGCRAKPNKDWLEVVGEALRPPEDPLFDEGDDEEPEFQQTTVPDPSPVFRTPEREEAFKKLRSKIFEMEEPCYELEKLGSVLKSMAYGDGDAEQSGIFVMGRIVQERALVVKDIFTQMLGLLKLIRLRDDITSDLKV